MNKYESRKIADLAKSKRFVSLLVTVLTSLLLMAVPELSVYHDMILKGMYTVILLVIGVIGAEDVVERIGDIFYAVWGKAVEIVEKTDEIEA